MDSRLRGNDDTKETVGLSEVGFAGLPCFFEILPDGKTIPSFRHYDPA